MTHGLGPLWRSALALACLVALALGASDQLSAATNGNGEAISQETPAPAQTLAFPEELAQSVARVAADIESAEKAVERVRERESGLAEQRAEIERIIAEAGRVIAALQPRIGSVRVQLEKLGPPPDKDAAPEPPALAAERARLTSALNNMTGAVRTAELSQVRARQLVGRVQELRQAIFARDLLRRAPSPLSAATWTELAEEGPRAARQIAWIAQGWWQSARTRIVELAVLIGVVVGVRIVAGWIAGRIRDRRIGPVPDVVRFFSRLRIAAWSAGAMAMPRIAAALTLYAGLSALGLLQLTIGQFADSALQAYLLFVVLSAVATAVLAPCPPEARLFDVGSKPARRLLLLVKGIAAIVALDLVASDVVRTLYLPLEIGVLKTALVSLAFASLLIAFVRTPLGPPDLQEPSGSLAWPRWLKLPFAVLAALIVLTTLVGYVALGRFISLQVMLVCGTGIVLLFAHLCVRNVAMLIADGKQPVGHMLETRLGLDSERTSHFSRLMVFLLDLGLLLAALPLVLLTWGYSSTDILDWLKLGIFGFEVGQFRISLARILIAVLLFLALLAGTRIIQRWLDRSVLKPARVDGAISHSVLMGIGYAGVALAALSALSYAGLDFTQLAIVAGALSLGIGFGLQAIFNNFVSGIILLIERPIKVGDWIIVNGQEGYVRRINVRATEIETFDRASLIVPNSELITGAVTNWTHRNPVGRLIINVGVSYKSDPEQVIAILTRIADSSTSLLKQPAPMVSFDDFGDSALLFSLRAFVPDVTRRLAVQTELRLAISKAFRDADIEIPYPQRDIHLRDLDGVKQALAVAMEARRREKEMDLTPAQ